MDITELIPKLVAGESAASSYIVSLVTDDDADKIASSQYDEEPQKFTGPNAVKLLADDTFGGMKHFLRGKIQAAVDLAWQIDTVRKPLREKANAAASKEMSSNTPA